MALGHLKCIQVQHLIITNQSVSILKQSWKYDHKHQTTAPLETFWENNIENFLFIFLDQYILLGVTRSMSLSELHMQGTPLNESSAHCRPYMNIWGFCTLILCGVLKVSWHLLLLLEHLPCCVCTGPWTDNPPLLKRLRLSSLHPWISSLYFLFCLLSHECSFSTCY